MADRTLTINHADGGSETYTLKTEDVLGVRSMQVDGETVTIDRTAPDLVRTIIADGQTITIDTTREGVRTLTVDGTEITIDRTEESNLDSFLQQFTGASTAYSLRDLASNSGNTTVVRVRRASDNSEADFKASEVSDGTLVTWVGAGNDGFVTTWYDQSGNGNDAVQETAGSQPKIVDAGTLLNEIKFDGVDDFMLSDVSTSGDDTTVLVAKNNSTTGSSLFLDNQSVGPKALYATSTKFQAYYGATSDLNYGSLNNDENLHFISTNATDSNNRYGSLNGIVDLLDAGTRNYSALSIGISRTGTSPLNGSIKELIIYDSDQSDNRVAIETNINNQYDIY